MKGLFLRKNVQIVAAIAVICSLLLLGILIFIVGKNGGERVVQEGKTLTLAKTPIKDARTDASEPEDDKVQAASDTGIHSKEEPAVSQADRAAVDKFKAKWDRWAPYAEINELIKEGRWDEILRMVREGEFGVDQPINPAGITLMEIALQRSQMEAVRELYELGADLTPPDRNYISLVCFAGNFKGLEFLCDHGVEISEQTGTRELYKAIAGDRSAIMKYLMELGFSPKDVEEHYPTATDLLSSSLGNQSSGEAARRLMELGYELHDRHVYKIANSGNPALIDFLLENGVDIAHMELDQYQLKLQSNPLYPYLESKGLEPFPRFFGEGDSFMDAVINSNSTDVAFMQYLEEKGLYADQTQLERVRRLAENYSKPVTILKLNAEREVTLYYPHAAEVAEYIAQQLGK